MKGMDYLADMLCEIFGVSPETGEDFTLCDVTSTEECVEIIMANEAETFRYTIKIEEI